jgi:hypothetical protein
VRVEPVCEGILDHLSDHRPGDRAAAQPDDDVEDDGRRAREREPRVLPHDSPDADREGSLDHDDPPDALESTAHLLGGPRTEAGDRQDPDGVALAAKLVDDHLDGADLRAERDDDGVGIAGAVPTQQAARLASEGRTEVRRRRGISSSASSCRACRRYLTSVKASGPTMAPMDMGCAGSRT